MNIEQGKYWDQSWSPIRGCSHGGICKAHCWAERMANRQKSKGYKGFVENGHWTGRVELIESELTKPLHWRKPRVVALNWMGDLFHESLPDEAIDRVFAVMALCPQHRFLVLTKRAKRMREYFTQEESPYFYPCTRVEKIARQIASSRAMDQVDVETEWPLPNVALGVSAEDQPRAYERINNLRNTPAAMRFVSIEPMLEAVNVVAWLAHLDWVIVGGESGPGARFMEVSWVRSIVAQCKGAGVPVFVKQLGAKPIDPTVKCGITCGCGLHYGFRDRKGGDPSEWPEDLRVRELPEFLEAKP